MSTPVLNTVHPAYPYLQKVWPFKEGSGTPAELISGTPVTLESGSLVWALESTGYGLTMDTGDALGLGVDVFPTAPDITILYRRRKTDSTLRQAGHFGTASDGTSTHRCSGVMPTDSGVLLFDFGGASNNVSRLQVSGQSFDTAIDTYVVRVNASEIRMWRNGTDIGHTTGGAPPTRVNTGAKGTINTGIFSAGDKQFLDLFAFYTGDLDDATCAALSAAPNDIFVGGMTGETGLTITATADLRTGASLSGSTGLTITATANLLAPDLSGSAGLTITAEAQLKDNASLLVQMMIASAIGSPLVVQMDIASAEVELEPLLVTMDVLEAARDPLLVTMEIIPAELRTSVDNQAPVAVVVLA